MKKNLWFGGARVSVLIWAASASAACGAPTGESLEIERQEFSVCGGACSSWVHPSGFNARRLVYVPDHEGDRIADFGRVGYKQGAFGLPSENLPTSGPLTICNNSGLCGTTTFLGQPSSAPAPLTDQNVDEICKLDASGNGMHDHGTWIQAALTYVGGQAADAAGKRGRVYLARGHYAFWNRLNVPDGVVLRGVSETASGTAPATTLHACGRGTPSLISINGSVGGVLSPLQHPILDELVPSGSNSVVVPTAGTENLYAVGAQVQITRLSPAAWLDDIGMNEVFEHQNCTPGTSCDVSWEPGSMNVPFDRTVTHVETVDGVSGRKRLFFDQPLTNALESKYGTHFIQQYTTPPGRAKNAGVYRLRGVSHNDLPWCPANTTLQCCAGNTTLPCTPVAITATTCNELDEVICPSPSHTPVCKDSAGQVIQPAASDQIPQYPYCRHSVGMVRLEKAEHCWISEIVAEQFPESAVSFGPKARWNTVDLAVYDNPVGPDEGGWRYSFSNNGQFNLIARSGARDGRHDFVMGSLATGPNVFLESESEQSEQDSGPHQGWATGTLFDNLTLHSPDPVESSGTIAVRNRYSAGTGHGWTGSSMVTWNSVTDGYRYYSPPTGQNWLIGSVGPLGTPNECYDVDGCPEPTPSNPIPTDPILKESHPHFDFGQISSHGTPTGALSSDPARAHSLYRSAATYWADFPQGGVFQREYFLGDADDFGNGEIGLGGETNDAIFVNPAFRSFVAQTLPTRGFDSTDDHKNIPFTFRFDLAPNETIVHAYIAVRLKRVGAWDSDASHKVQIATADVSGNGFTDNTTTYPFSTISELITGPSGFSVNQTPVVRILDLAPRLSAMNVDVITEGTRRYGEINVNFYRRTRVDWASLSLWITRT